MSFLYGILKELVIQTRNPAHPSHDSQSICTEELGIANLLVNNAIKHFLLIVSREWRLNITHSN